MKLEAKVLSIISDNIDFDQEIKLDDHLLNDLHVDSISMLMIINELEYVFEIQIDEDDIKEVEYVSDIVDRLASLVIA